MLDLMKTYQSLAETIKKCNKVVFMVAPSTKSAKTENEELIRLGIPIFTDEVCLGNALGKIYNRNQLLKIKENTNYTHYLRKAKCSKTELISDKDAWAYLIREGLPVVETHFYADTAALKEHMDTLKMPLAIKATGLNHKTENQGIYLNITTPEALLKHAEMLLSLKNVS